MKALSRQKLWQELKSGNLAPVYLLYGPETFLRDAAARTIADLTFSEGDLRDFNETAFSLNRADNLRPALAAAEQLPMMSAKRLIRITDVRISSTGRLDTIRDEDEGLLSSFLANPPPQSVVIFIADELSGVRKLSKLLKGKCVSVEFAQLDDDARKKWVADEIKKEGSVIDDGDLGYLLGMVGSDIRRLSNEIAKLSTAALPDGRITTDHIDSLVANTGKIGQWDLVNHLNDGNRHQACATLKKMLDDGEEPLMILGQIAGSYRRSIIDGRFDPAKMEAKMKRLAKTDLAIKTSVGASGPAGARMHIEMLVCELALT